MTSKRGSRVRISLSPRNAISKADAAPQGAAFLQVAGALGELALQMPRLLADCGLWPLLPLLIAHGQPELPEGVARRNLAAPLLQRILFQLLYVAVYAGELVRDRNALWTLRDALLAVDAVVGLAQGRDSPVVADQVCLAKLHVIFLILALRDQAAVDAGIVMLEYSRNIYSVRARHAILAVVAVYGREVGDDSGALVAQESEFRFAQRLEVHERAQVVLQMLLIDHSAQDGEYPRIRADELESPGSVRCLRIVFLQHGHDSFHRIGQASSLERLHDHDRNHAGP